MIAPFLVFFPTATATIGLTKVPFPDANQFKEAFEAAQKSNKELAGTPAAVETSSTSPAGPSASAAKEVTDKENEAAEEAAPSTEAVKEPTGEAKPEEAKKDDA